MLTENVYIFIHLQSELYYFWIISKWKGWRLGLRCITPFSTIFQLHVYRGGQFYWRRNTTDLSQVTDKLYHIMLYEYTSLPAAFELYALIA